MRVIFYIGDAHTLTCTCLSEVNATLKKHSGNITRIEYKGGTSESDLYDFLNAPLKTRVINHIYSAGKGGATLDQVRKSFRYNTSGQIHSALANSVTDGRIFRQGHTYYHDIFKGA